MKRTLKRVMVIFLIFNILLSQMNVGIFKLFAADSSDNSTETILSTLSVSFLDSNNRNTISSADPNERVILQISVGLANNIASTGTTAVINISESDFVFTSFSPGDQNGATYSVNANVNGVDKTLTVTLHYNEDGSKFITIEGLTQGETATIELAGYFTTDTSINESVTVSGITANGEVTATLNVENVTNQITGTNTKTVVPTTISFSEGDYGDLAKNFPIVWTIGTTITIPDSWQDEEEITSLTITDTLYFGDGMYLTSDTDLSSILSFDNEILSANDFETIKDLSGNIIGLKLTKNLTGADLTNYLTDGETISLNYNNSYIVVTDETEITNTLATTYNSTNFTDNSIEEATTTTTVNITTGPEYTTTKSVLSYESNTMDWISGEYYSGYFIEGDTIEYTITVKNTGDETGDVTITDAIPEGTEFVSATNSSSGDEYTTTYDTDTVTSVSWTLEDMAVGETRTVTVTLKITNDEDFNLKNTVTVDNDGAEEEVESAEFPVQKKKPNLEITKTAESSGGFYSNEGDTVTYTIVVKNTGELSWTGEVEDDFPEGLEYVLSSIDGVSDSSGTYSENDGTIKWSEVTINAGESMTFIVKGTVKSGTTGTISNTAYVAKDTEYEDEDTAETSVFDIGEVINDTVITKTADTTYVSTDDEFTYTIALKNSGDAYYVSDLDNGEIVVTDTIPAGLTYESASWSYGDTTKSTVGVDYDGTSKTVTFTITSDEINTVTAGSTIYFYITVKVDLEATDVDQTITNTAITPTFGNKEDTADVRLRKSTSLTIEKYVTAIYDENGKLIFTTSSSSEEITTDVEGGYTVTYNVKISNTGDTNITLDSTEGLFTDYFSGFDSTDIGNLTIKVYKSDGTYDEINPVFQWVYSGTSFQIDLSNVIIEAGDYIVLEYSLVTDDNFTVGTNSITNNNITDEAQEVTDKGEISKTVGLISKDTDFSNLSNSSDSYSNIETYDDLSVIASKLENYYLVYKIHVETGSNLKDTYTITDTISDNLEFVTDLTSYNNSYGSGPVIAVYYNIVYSWASTTTYTWLSTSDISSEINDQTLTVEYVINDTTANDNILSLSFDVYYLVTITDEALTEIEQKIADGEENVSIELLNNVTVKSTNTDESGNPVLDETDETTVDVNDGTLYPGLDKEFVGSYEMGENQTDEDGNVKLTDSFSSATAGSGLVWSITIKNEYSEDGKTMRNYTVTDTLPDAYYFDTNYLNDSYTGAKYYPSIVIYDSEGNVKKTWSGKDGSTVVLPCVYENDDEESGNLIIPDDYDYSGYSTLVWVFEGEEDYYLSSGDYMVITYSTVIKSGKSGAFLNTARLTTVQDFDKADISDGTLVDDNTIESTDFAYIYSFMTSSYKEIEYTQENDDDPPTDTGISTRDDNGVLDNYVQGVQGQKVKYTLSITNQSSVNVGDLCIIDRLPYVGDIGVIANYARDSAFAVKYDSFIGAEIVSDDGTTRDVETYVEISFSNNKTSTFSYGSRDWYGEDDVAQWYDSATDSTVNVRFYIEYDSADNKTYLAPNETLKIYFYGLVPEYVENTGEVNIAWNNFAYGYTAYSASNTSTSLSSYCIAEPAKVGVWVEEEEVTNAGEIVVSKTYDKSTDGDDTVTVYFVLYKYNEKTSDYEPYSDVVSLQVSSGSEGATENFGNLSPGTKYRVYETDEYGNVLESSNNEYYTITGQGEEVEIEGGDTHTVTITNTALSKYTASIKITKNVIEYDGSASSDTSTYYFVIIDKDSNYVYNDGVTSANFTSDALISVVAGSSTVVSGLEAGEYRIYEVTSDGEKVASQTDVGYTVSYDSGNVVTISRSDGTDVYEVKATNTLEQVTETSYVAEKVWEDFENKDNSRPTSITLQLKANGEDYGDPVTLSAGNDNTWDNEELTYEWTDLPIYSDESNTQKITYTVIETSSAEGYTASYDTPTDGKTVITNKYNPLIEVAGTKTWADDNDTSNRPSYITVNLWQNDSCIKSLKVYDSDDWSYSFKELPKYDTDGNAYTYTITEDTVSGYTATIDGYDIINTLNTTPASETVNLNVTKTWVDSDSGTRPESITVNLLQNGKIIRSVNITENDGWEYTFEELPKYDEDNEEYIYTITENEVDNYQTSIEGTKITNTYTKEETPESPEEDEPDTPSEDEPDTPNEDESENPSEDETENSNEEQSEDSETTEESNSEDSEETETTVSQSVKTGDNIIISFMTLMISFGIEVVIRRLHMKNKD